MKKSKVSQDKSAKEISRTIAFGILRDLKAKLDSGRVTYTQLLSFIEQKTGAKLHRVCVHRWFADDREKRVEPGYGMGVILEQFNESIANHIPDDEPHHD